MKKTAEVTTYIAKATPKAQPMLRQLRQAIRAAAPKAEEKISYGMPYYHYYGRLAYFAAFRDHVSVFAWGPPTKQYAKEIAPYQTGKGTLQFPLGSKIPVTLIRKLIVARKKINEAAKKQY